MPNISNITIADGQTVPADKLFVPHRPQQGDIAAVWFNKDSDSPIGYRKITLLTRSRADGGRVVKITIADPVLASVNDACCTDANIPQVSYTDFVNIEFVMPRGATNANRKDILAFAKNLLGTDVVKSVVVDDEVVY